LRHASEQIELVVRPHAPDVGKRFDSAKEAAISGKFQMHSSEKPCAVIAARRN
jgi:hypothetical protein